MASKGGMIRTNIDYQNYGKDDSLDDIKIGWVLFRKNLWPIMANQLITIAILYLAVVSIKWGVTTILPVPFRASPSNIMMVLLLVDFTAYFVFFLFQGRLYGIAYDVMSSGDQFAEARKTFQDLRVYGSRYLLFGLILYGPIVLLSIIEGPLNIIASGIAESLLFAMFPVAFACFIAFMEAGPALRVKRGIKEAFRENFRTMRRDLRRILKTSILTGLLCFVPHVLSIFLVISPIFLKESGTVGSGLIVFAFIITEDWTFFVGMPVQALVATRIYNSLHLPNE
jgi:hypothetical protein